MLIVKKHSKGYTMGEAMVVVVILVMAGYLFFTRFEHAVERMKAAEAINLLNALRESQEVYRQENGAFSAVLTALEVSIPSNANFATPQVFDSNPAILASMARNSANFRLGTAYTLEITQTGDINCSGSSYCTTLGY